MTKADENGRMKRNYVVLKPSVINCVFYMIEPKTILLQHDEENIFDWLCFRKRMMLSIPFITFLRNLNFHLEIECEAKRQNNILKEFTLAPQRFGPQANEQEPVGTEGEEATSAVNEEGEITSTYDYRDQKTF